VVAQFVSFFFFVIFPFFHIHPWHIPFKNPEISRQFGQFPHGPDAA